MLPRMAACKTYSRLPSPGKAFGLCLAMSTMNKTSSTTLPNMDSIRVPATVGNLRAWVY